MTAVKFNVTVPVCRSLTVFVTGNCPELGDWAPNSARPLSLQSSSDSGDVWSSELSISAQSVEFRYFLGTVLTATADPNSTDSVIAVQTWESCKVPRKLELCGEAMVDAGMADFGVIDGQMKCVDRGWLTGQSEVCIRIHAKSLRLLDSVLAGHCCRIKCTTIDLRPPVNSEVDTNISSMCDGRKLVGPVFVSTFSNPGSSIQSDDGVPFDGAVDHLTFRIQTCSIENVAFKFALFLDDSDGGLVGFSKLPEIGVSFWHPNASCRSEISALPILSLHQEVIGTLKIDALVVNSIKNCPRELDFSPQRWTAPGRTLDIGHRGMGSSYINGVPNARVRENTVLSFSEAARAGADMVEFDVMLTRDEVPVIFHDFMACMNVIASNGTMSRVKVPISDLTLAELNAFNVTKWHDMSPSSPVNSFVNEDERAFPTLRHCFQVIDPKIGFNIEVKYCMHLRSTGQYEEGVQHFTERNTYIDTILREVFQHAGDRPIVLSCFDPDTCTLMRAKQTRYPVVFLSQGETLKYATFQDPRSASLSLAVKFALSESLMGVALHTEDLLKDLELIVRAHSQGLAVFSWGEDNNSVENLQLQRDHRMDGMIYDRLDEFKGAHLGEE